MEKRLHSKIILSDDTALIGAHNLRDELSLDHEGGVHNISLRFKGSVVNQLDAVFRDLWQLNEGKEIAYQYTVPISPSSGAKARIIYSDPIERAHKFNHFLDLSFHAARKRIYIWMPYLIPSQAIRNTLISAARMKLDVRVLVPKKSDSMLVDNAHDLVVSELLVNDIKCAQSEGVFDHSKIIIIDDVTILGSTNLDYRSLFRNYEANIEVNDKAFTNSVVDLFDKKFANANQDCDCHQGKVRHMINQFTSLIAGLY